MNDFENDPDVMLANFKYWENRKLYLKVMERFINERIDGTQFYNEFLPMWRADHDKTYRFKE